jgi:hypothetical protein
MATFGRWKYSPDRNATILAYGRVDRGGVDTRDCVYCRNFRLGRARVFPVEFLALADELGIDPRKDAEVYYNARLAPSRHDYGGWYHFIGTLDQTGDFQAVDLGGGFTVWMCRASAPRLPSLEGMPVVQVEFDAQTVPWLLAGPEPP